MKSNKHQFWCKKGKDCIHDSRGRKGLPASTAACSSALTWILPVSEGEQANTASTPIYRECYTYRPPSPALLSLGPVSQPNSLIPTLSWNPLNEPYVVSEHRIWYRGQDWVQRGGKWSLLSFPCMWKPQPYFQRPERPHKHTARTRWREGAGQDCLSPF